MENIKEFYFQYCVPFFLKLWVNPGFWRPLALILLLVIFLTYLFRERIKLALLQEDKIRHDQEIFRLLDLIMPERKLMEILKQLEKEYTYGADYTQFVHKFSVSLSEESRQYVLPALRKSSLVLRQSMDELDAFLQENFIAFPQENKDEAPKMYPNPEIDGGGNSGKKDSSKFAEFSKKLSEYSDDVRKNYQKYRLVIKQHIQV